MNLFTGVQISSVTLMFETLIFALLEAVIVLVGLVVGVALFFGVLFAIIAPIVFLIDFLYGKLKLRWYRMYFDLKRLPDWKRKFIYKRLFGERWWMWLQ